MSGYNGTTDNRAFALQLKTWPLPDITCDPITDLWTSEVTAPPTPEGINAVFLYNAAAYVEAGGNEAALINRIEHAEWALQGITPAAVAVDSYPGVRGALSAWAGDYCTPEAANAVVRQIGVEILDPILAANPDLEYITIVGDDSHVPFARNTDGVVLANEASHGLGLLEDNAVKAALAEGYYLTDTPYVGQSYKIADREFFIPIQAGGRLTFDNPGQLEARFDTFLASGGILSGNGKAVIGGYDFLLDAALAAAAALDPAFDLVTQGTDASGTVSLLSELWNEDHFLNALGPAGSTASVAVIEAHFDESNLAPANADPGGSNLPLSPELLSVQDYLSGGSQAAFILSPGCHAALDTDGVDWTDITDILGNFFFGYGDTEIVALSELLVERVSARIATQTLGLATRNAINRQVEDLYVITPYDLKVMEQFTVYGFPMARAAVEIPVEPIDALATPDLTIFNDAYTGLPSAFLSLDFTGDPASTAGLVYPDLDGLARAPDAWTAAGYDVLTVRGHAVLPQVTLDVTSTGRVAAGVLVELTSTPKEFGFDPLIFDPQSGEVYSPASTTTDLRLEAGDISFPASVQSSVRRGLGEDSTLRDRTVIVPARHYTEDGSSILEIFTDVELQTFYRPDGWTEADEPAVPFIERAFGRSRDNAIEFDITVQPPANGGTTERVLVLYRPDDDQGGPWFTLELASPDGVRWIGRDMRPTGTYEYFVQGVSNLGDVVQATGKAINYDTLDDVLQQGLTVTVKEAGTPILDYWYPARDADDDVVAEALAAPGTSLCSYVLERDDLDVDDPGFVVGSGSLSGSQATFILEGDGEYLLTVFGGDCDDPNDVGVLAVAIDGTAPTASITVTTEPDTTKEVTLVAFDLSPDDTAGSGVQRIEYCLTEVCNDADWIVYDGPFPITETTVVKYRAVDYLGFESDIGSETVVVDLTAPALSYTATSNLASYTSGDWTNGDVSVTFRAEDDESGVASLTVNGSVVADNPDGAPFLDYTMLIAVEGETSVTYSAVDVVGNVADAQVFTARIDRTDPTVEVSAVATSNGDESPYSSGTWTNADAVSVTLTASDNVEVVDFIVTVDGVEVSSPVLVTAEGQTSISYSAVDPAGNTVTDSFDVWIDRTDPTVAALTLPSYDPEAASGSFTCDDANDGLSPLAACVVEVDGTVVNPDGSFSGTFDIDSTPVGTFKTVTVTATDVAGNQYALTEQYGSQYGYCYLYDPERETSGAVAIKLRITTDTWNVRCDDTENNISSQSLTIYAYRLDGNGVEPQDSGKANSSPTYEFRYDRKLDGYIYNLNVEGLADGPHVLDFTIEQDWTDLETYPNGEGLIVYQARFAYKN